MASLELACSNTLTTGTKTTVAVVLNKSLEMLTKWNESRDHYNFKKICLVILFHKKDSDLSILLSAKSKEVILL